MFEWKHLHCNTFTSCPSFFLFLCVEKLLLGNDLFGRTVHALFGGYNELKSSSSRTTEKNKEYKKFIN